MAFGFCAVSVAAFVLGLPAFFLDGRAQELYHLILQRLVLPAGLIFALAKLWHFIASSAANREISPMAATLLALSIPMAFSLFALIQPDIFAGELLCAPYDCLNTYVGLAMGFGVLPQLFPLGGFAATPILLCLIFYTGWRNIPMNTPITAMAATAASGGLYSICGYLGLGSMAQIICLAAYAVSALFAIYSAARALIRAR